MAKSAWRELSDPPAEIKGQVSVRVLGILENGTHVFAQYTPYYKGSVDADKLLWVCEGYRWSVKPKKWMLLPCA